MLSFVLAAPSFAQRLADESSNRAVSTIAGPRDVRAPDAGFFSGSRSGVRVARETYVVETGTADTRQGVVGTVPLGENATIGLGLYKVARYSRSEPDFKKLAPVYGTGARSQKIAAVGLSFSF